MAADKSELNNNTTGIMFILSKFLESLHGKLGLQNEEFQK